MMIFVKNDGDLYEDFSKLGLSNRGIYRAIIETRYIHKEINNAK